MDEHTMADAAFGPDPGRWPLPTARTTGELWLRAVAAGGQGRFFSARADLAVLLSRPSPPGLASLAHSTRASFLRQQGWHRRAHDADGTALALAGDCAEARTDALVGLAADALGVRRLAASGALLARAEQAHAGIPSPPPRLAIRLAWVRAELAMARGEGAEALRHAAHGVELAESALPRLRRHRVKSDVVLAAALCCAGDLPAARRVADAALADTATYRLVPLRWALACLLADIGSADHSPGEVAGIRDRSATFVARHGGPWNGG